MTRRTLGRVAGGVAMAMIAAACRSPVPGDATSAPSTAITLPAATSSVPATSGDPTTVASTTPELAQGPFRCTEVIGFSQTGSDNPLGGGWFTEGRFEQQPGIDDDRWQLRWLSGSGMTFWADPDFRGWKDSRVFSRCAEGPVDRVVFQITDRFRTVEEWAAAIDSLVGTLRSKFPTARIDLIPIVGGPNDGQCQSSDGGVVHATQIHPLIDQAIPLVAGDDVAAGPSPEVAQCEQFRDKPGHLTPDGARFAAAQLAAAYGAG